MERQAFDAIPLGPETWVPRDDREARLARDSSERQREAQDLGAPAPTPLLNALEDESRRARCTRSACRSEATGRPTSRRQPTTLTPQTAASAPALAAVLVPDTLPEVRLVHEWLDSWSGLGLIVGGMTSASRTPS
jgi:hypothetical protein